MYALLCIAIEWVVAVVCIKIMRKIQPESKAYPIWAVFIAVCLTVSLLWHEFLG